MAHHFNNCCNGDISNMCIGVVLTAHEPGKRKIQEAKRIKRLGTLAPFGKNPEES